MIRALLDTNVILDLVLNRQGFVENAIRIFQYIDEKRLEGYMTATTVTDIYFVSEREKDRIYAALALRKLIVVLGVLPVDGSTIREALNSPIKDFEDAVQTEAAKAMSMDFIVTRNKRDFSCSSVPAASPEEMIQKLR